MSISKNGHPITSLDQWKQYAPPKSAHHWVDGRSAKEVARAWLAGGGQALPGEIQAALVIHPRFGTVLTWDCEPEAKLRFDCFPGEPRNSDLAVMATDSFGRYVLAVEAKADETYGQTVASAFEASRKRQIKNQQSNGIARIKRLIRLLFRPCTANEPKARELRYQLLTAAAGAIAEAKRQGVSRAILLVHEFVTPGTRDNNHKRNAADLQKFLHRLSGRPFASLRDGQIYGPFSPPGEPGIELFVGKAERNLRHSHNPSPSAACPSQTLGPDPIPPTED
ncbi:MAG: hypothetical protein ABTR07_17710 [Candidatus Competibacter denitrificans]